MITCLREVDRDELLRYIGNERGRCLYMFMDIIKFGLENSEISVWAQRIGGRIIALIMKYHNGLHVYAKQEDVIWSEILDLIKQLRPALICGEKRIVQCLSANLPQ